MKRQSIRAFAVGGILILAAASLLLPLCCLASVWEAPVQRRGHFITTKDDTATPGHIAIPDNIATPGSLASDEEDGDLLDDVSAFLMQETVYTVCDYYFRYIDWPFQWKIGEPFDADEELDTFLTVYLDGPGGHVSLEDDLVLPVEWDLSQVDFDKEGIYPVTGVIDTDACSYLIDWDNAPSPSFLFETGKDSTLSFHSKAEGNTLILGFEMEEVPFSFELGGNMVLYESRDGGNNWYDITRSARVQITEDYIVISGITSDSMFQTTDMNLGYFYSDCSDIAVAKVDTKDGIRDIRIIPSGGRQGGEDWNEETGSRWFSDSTELDGPYPILYYAVNRFMPSLTVPVLKGTEAAFETGRYDRIWVYYGDRMDGYWSAYQILDVEWDWTPLDAIDWNQAGETIIHGRFTGQAVGDADPRLDFDSMPELILTISVYEQKTPLTMLAKKEELSENQSVTFGFYDESDYAHVIPVSFGDGAGLTVWCSVDAGNTWYDITARPGVFLSGDTLTVSGLKDSILRSRRGYQFQLQQNVLMNYEAFSSGVNITHSSFGLVFANAAIGGERGGGKRQDKPPEGLFDIRENTLPTEDTGESRELPEEPDEPSPPQSPEKSPSKDSNGSQSPDNGNHGRPSSEYVKASQASEASATGRPASPAAVPSMADPSAADLSTADLSAADLSAADPSATGSPMTESSLAEPFMAESFMAEPPLAGSHPPDPSTEDPFYGTDSRPDAKTSSHSPSPDVTQVAKACVPPAQSPGHDTMRVIGSLVAVLTGAAAGIFMIRRR